MLPALRGGGPAKQARERLGARKAAVRKAAVIDRLGAEPWESEVVWSDGWLLPSAKTGIHHDTCRVAPGITWHDRLKPGQGQKEQHAWGWLAFDNADWGGCSLSARCSRQGKERVL